jgi:hypothetical protein
VVVLERLGNPQAAVWNTGKYGNLAAASNATQWTVDARMGVLSATSLVYRSMSCSGVNCRTKSVPPRGHVSENPQQFVKSRSSKSSSY